MPRKSKIDWPRIAEKIDHEKVTQVLKSFHVPDTSREMVHNRLDDLVQIVKNLEDDLDVETYGDLAGIRPQDQRAAFHRMAKELEAVADEISNIDAPRQRYVAGERQAFLAPAGATELRTALGAGLTSIFSPAFLSAYEIPLADWQPPVGEPRTNRHSPPMRPDYEFLFEKEAFPIAVGLLKILSRSMLRAEDELRKNTLSGPREKKTVQLVLLNLVAIWWDAFLGEKKLYFDVDHQDLLFFCQQLGNVLGIEILCTETRIKNAIEDFKRLS